MSSTPKLIVLSSQHRGKQFELVKDVYTAGRSEDRDICVKDPTISTYHCDFIRVGDTYMVRDNNSTNGTRVNNYPIEEKELKSSDIVQLGSVEFLYDAEDKDSDSPASSQTQTGITITDINPNTATVRRIPVPQKDFVLQSQKKQKAFTWIIVALVVLVLGLVGLLIFLLQN